MNSLEQLEMERKESSKGVRGEEEKGRRGKTKNR